jgi:hypothetical protein
MGSVYMTQTRGTASADWWPEEEKTAKRPETNKGGREEEEMRLGISTGNWPGRLRSGETGVGGDTLAITADMALVMRPQRKKFRRLAHAADKAGGHSWREWRVIMTGWV